MSTNEIISLVIIIVIALLIALFAFYFSFLSFKREKSEIKEGKRDRDLIKDYEKSHSKKRKVARIIDLGVNVLLTALFITLSVVSIVAQVNENAIKCGGTTALVVRSDSMATVNKTNTYITENNLTDQFERNDLIYVNGMPEESQIKLYDIVLFRFQDKLVVHRIVKIEEPDLLHPDKKAYITKGDANSAKDDRIYYSDMLGIYSGFKIKYVGTVILFFQKPLGFLSIALLLLFAILMPIAENKLIQDRDRRLKHIGYIDENGVVNADFDREKFITVNLLNQNKVLDVLDAKENDVSNNKCNIDSNVDETEKDHYQKLLDNKTSINVIETIDVKPQIVVVAKKKIPPFEERIKKADKDIKENYKNLKNEITSYGVKSRISYSGETFRLHNKTYVKIVLSGKKLKLFFALNPRDYKDSPMPIIDVSHKVTYKNTPLALKVKSSLSVRRAHKLIADAMKKDGLIKSTKK